MNIRVLLVLLLFLLGAKANAQILDPILDPKYSDMELEHSVSPGPYSIGDTITYTITIRNLGPDDNTGVVMSFKGFGARLFEDPKQVSHYPIGNQAPTSVITNTSLGSVSWYFRSIFPKGGSAVYTLRAIIDIPQFIPYFINAFTLGTNIDVNLNNNSIEKQLCAAPPKPGNIRGNKSLCINSTGNVLEVDPDENISRFKWVLPEGWTITSGFETNRIEFSTNGIQADWVVSVQSVNFCGESRGVSTYNLTTVAVPPPMPKAITGNPEVCAGSKNLSYSIEEVPGAISYAWTLPSDWTLESGQGTKSIKVSVGSASGTIKVVAVNGCGGSASRDLPVIVSPNVPAAPSRITGDAVVCANTGTATYTIDEVANAIRYEWVTQPGWEILNGQGTKTIVLKPGVGSAKIGVRAVNACGSSKETTFDVLGLEEKPVLGAITGLDAFCASDANQTYSVAEVVGIKDYKWSVPTGWSIVSGQGTNRIVVKTGTTSGTVSLIGYGVCNDEARASINVTVSTQAPAAPSAIRGSVVPCVGQEFTYTVNPVNGATEYLWAVPSDWVIISGQGGTSLVVKVGRTPGQISVYAKNACSQSAAVDLAVNPSVSAPAVPRFTGETMPCIGRQVKYTLAVSTQGIAYAWQVPTGWSIVSGQGTGSITVTVGADVGQISVTATNGCGTSSEASLAVTPSNGVPPSDFEISGPQTLCDNNTDIIKYSVSEVATANTFQWRVPTGWAIVSGQGTSEISVRAGSASGNVSVSAQNGCGLSATKDFAVVVSSPLVSAPAQISGLASICSKTETTYSIAAVAGALSYQWTVPADWTVKSGQGTTSLVVVVGSTGSISVKANNGCGASPAASLNVAVSNTTLVAGNITGEAAVCAASNEQVYTTPAVSGAAAYRWTVPTGWTIVSGQNTRSIRVRVASAGTISVAIDNPCGVGASSSLAVTLSNQAPAKPSAITYSANGNNPCAGQSNVTYSVNAVTGADEYVWTVPNGWVIESGQGTRSITVKTGSTAGQVTVAAKNNCGQSEASAVTVTPVQSVPVTPAGIAGETVPCIGKQQVFSVQNPSANFTYDWVLPTGWSFVSGQGTATITVIVGTTAGQVKVTTSNSCGSSAEASLAVTPNNGLPSFTSTIDGPKSFCTATNTPITYSISPASGASAYQWAFPAGWTVVSGQGTPSVTVRPGSGSGEVQVSASNGCGQTTTQRLPVSVSNGGPATPGAISGTQNVCANAVGTTYSVATVAGASEYVWEVPTSWRITSGQGTNSVVVQAGQSSGQIRVVAKNECGTSSASSLNVSVSSGTLSAGDISGATTICLASNEQVYTTPAVSGAAAYMWVVPSAWTIVSGQNTRSIRVRITGSGTISVAIDNSCGSGTSTSLAVAVSDQAPAKPSAITYSPNGTTPCAGQTNITYSVNAVAGAQEYVWTVPAGWVIASGQGSRSITVTSGNAAGQVTVVAKNYCGQSEASTLTVNPVQGVPATPAGVVGEIVPCIGKEQIFSVRNPSANDRYDWTLPSGWSFVSGQGSATITVLVGTTAGQVKVTTSNSCGSSAAASLAVTPNNGVPTFTSTIDGPNAFCSATNTPITYSISPASGASSYQWTFPTGWTIVSGQGSTSVSVRPGAGSGDVQVSASNGCGQTNTQRLPVSVSNGGPATPGAISGEQNVCSNVTGIAYSVAAVTGASEYVWEVPTSWTITSGQGTNAIIVRTGQSTGQVRVIAKNACGSSSASVLSINMSQNPPAAVGPITGDKIFCSSNQQRVYSVAEASGTKDYVWSVPTGWTIVSGQNSRSITVTPSNASGYVRVVAVNYCSSTRDSVLVTVNSTAPVALGAIQGDVAPCQGQEDVQYSVNAVAGVTSYTWTLPSDWTITSGAGTNTIRVITGRTAGTVSVVATNGCSVSNPATLAVTPVTNGPAVPTAIVGKREVCAGEQQTYTIQNPMEGIKYNWTLPNGWAVVSGNGTSTLVVRVGSTAGSLSVIAQNSCGTSSARTFAVIPSTSAPVLGTLTGVSDLCAGTTQTYSIENATSQSTYTWVLPSGWAITSGAGTSSIQVKVGNSSGNVEVTATNGCGQSAKKTLAVRVGADLQTAPGAINGEKDVCAQKPEVVYSVAAVAGATGYTWKVPQGWTIVKGAGTASITVKVGATAGKISVAAKNDCAETAESSIDVTISNALPMVLGPVTGPDTVCSSQRFTYSIAAVTGVTNYQWTVPTGWVVESGQGTRSITVVAGTNNGRVSVVAQNGCGNSSTPSVRQVQSQNGSLVRPTAIQTNAGNTTPCANQEGLVFKVDPVVGATSYEWAYPADWKVESGQGTNSITFTAGKLAGTISVVAKNNCATTESRTITVTPKDGAPVIAGEIVGGAAVCGDNTPVTYQIANVTGADAVRWSVPTGWTLVSGQNTTTLVVIPKASGNLEFTATNTCGGTTRKNLQVVVNTNSELPTSALAGPKEFCLGTTNQVYEIASIAGATYTWQIPADWQVVAGGGTNKVTLAPKKAGAAEVKVTVSNACGKSFTSGVNVTVAPALQPLYEITDESTACIGYQFSAPLQENVTYTWTIVSGGSGWSITEGQGTNRVKLQSPAGGGFTPAQIKCEVSNAGCSMSSQVIDIEPTPLAPELSVPNTFSPNNDGVNDLWQIENLLSYPVNEVVVLNRWGSEVFRQKGYKNDWTGGGLAEGTYFYYVKVRLCEGNEVTLKGYVMLMR